MTGTTRPGDARVPLHTVAALLGMLAMALVLAGCGQGSGGTPQSNDRGGEVATPPDVEGTWSGTYTGTSEGRATLSLAQDGGEVSGNIHFASEEGQGYLGPLEGTAERAGDAAGEVSLRAPEYRSEEGAEGVPTLDLRVEGGFVITGDAEYPEGNSYEFELRRTDVSTPEGLAEAAVQAVHDRNYIWLAEHGTSAWREGAGAETDEELAQELKEIFDYQADIITPPPTAVGVDLVEESVVASEYGPQTSLEFDYEMSDGGVGYAVVEMVEAGTSGSGYAYQLEDVALTYESEEGQPTFRMPNR